MSTEPAVLRAALERIVRLFGQPNRPDPRWLVLRGNGRALSEAIAAARALLHGATGPELTEDTVLGTGEPETLSTVAGTTVDLRAPWRGLGYQGTRGCDAAIGVPDFKGPRP